jgi:hypothetical protein
MDSSQAHSPARENAVGNFLILVIILFALLIFSALINISQITWAILFLALTSFVIPAVLWLARGLSLRYKILALTITYLCLMIDFASGYYLIYFYKPNSFGFSEQLINAQLKLTTSLNVSELNEKNEQLDLLLKLESIPKNLLTTFLKSNRLVFSNGNSIELTKNNYFGIQSGSKITYNLVLSISNKEYTIYGDNICDPKSKCVLGIANAKSTVEILNQIHALKIIINEQRMFLQTKLIQKNPEWKYLDFIYFSSITIGTVGYGDIVPTSYLTRVLGAIESLMGILLIAFALSFIWPNQQMIL